MPSDDPLSKGPPAGDAAAAPKGSAASRKPQAASPALASPRAALLADPFDPKLSRLARLVLLGLAVEIAALYGLGRLLS